MSTNKPYHIIVSPENRHYINYYYEVILFYTDQDKPVPAHIIRGFLGYLEDELQFERNLRSQKAIKFAQLAKERISISKGYDFKWRMKRADSNEGSAYTNVDLEVILYEAILAYLLYEADTSPGKDDTLSFFYIVFTEEYMPMLSKVQQKLFTPYKRAVYAGILTQAVGHKLFTTKSISNHAIYQASKHVLKRTIKSGDI